MKCLPGAIVEALMTEMNGSLIRTDNPQSTFRREVNLIHDLDGQGADRFTIFLEFERECLSGP